MKNYNKIDPSIAFCSESATANFSNFFNNKDVIYRKLINSYSSQIEKDCYIAIDIRQHAETGKLTLIDYRADIERLGIKELDQHVFGKVIAYSKPNDLDKFFVIGESTGIEGTLKTTHSDKPTILTSITATDIKRFSNTLETILNTGIFNEAVERELSLLNGSLVTFKALLRLNGGKA